MNGPHFAMKGSPKDIVNGAADLPPRETAPHHFASSGPLFSEGLMVFGPPRSGTTWLHNKLIEIRRYRGIPGDDMHGTDSRSPFLTDENPYIHRLLLRIADKRQGADRQFWIAMLRNVAALIYIRFGRNREFILKSPYYCFFLDTLRRARLGQKFIYMKRSPDAVANSMLLHPHLSRLISLDYDSNFEMRTDNRNFELACVPAEVAFRYRNDYERLTSFDRALFKYLCFSCSFAATKHLLPEKDLFIFDYELFGASIDQQEAFFLFLDLNETQKMGILKSFRTPAKTAQKPLPPHDPEFRAAVLRAENAVWNDSAK